jgi:hypothetical protein
MDCQKTTQKEENFLEDEKAHNKAQKRKVFWKGLLENIYIKKNCDGRK